MVELTKGESKQLGEYQIRFVRFEMAQHGQSGSMSVGAVLDVAIHDEHHEVIPSMTITERGQQQFNPSDLPVPQNMSQGLIKPRIALTGMSVEEKKVMLQVMGLGTEGNHPPPQELVVEISTKPLMMVVWTGVVLILAGTTISLKRRLESDVQSVA
jgi:cytochrome c-type biogenesis protein CcmF